METKPKVWSGELCASNLTPASLPASRSAFRIKEGRGEEGWEKRITVHSPLAVFGVLLGPDQCKCLKTVMTEGLSTQNYGCPSFCFVIVVRERSLLSRTASTTPLEEKVTWPCWIYSLIWKCIWILIKCRLLPADSPNWKMGEVSVCEKLGNI